MLQLSFVRLSSHVCLCKKRKKNNYNLVSLSCKQHSPPFRNCSQNLWCVKYILVKSPFRTNLKLHKSVKSSHERHWDNLYCQLWTMFVHVICLKFKDNRYIQRSNRVIKTRKIKIKSIENEEIIMIMTMTKQ